MKKNTIIKIIGGIGATIVILFSINVALKINKVGEYKLTKPYEELTFTEKLAAKVGGYHFDTKQELIDKGLILTEEQEEVKRIVAIFKEVPEMLDTKDGENTDEKIKKCEEILNRLHQENSSGRINTDGLIDYMDNCISMTQNYMFALKAYKDLNVNNYKSYSDKLTDDFNKINNSFDRFGFR